MRAMNERLRERERIIMFPLLSRLPQLSPKRGSQSTCLLIHLELGNNRTPPICLCLSLPRSFISVCLCFHTFPYPTSIRSTGQGICFLSVSAATSATSLLIHRASSLTSPLGSTWVYQRAPPLSLSLSPLPLCHTLLQGTGRGKTKRLNILDCTPPEEKQWFDFPCVVSDRIVLFVWPVCVFCSPPLRQIGE